MIRCARQNSNKRHNQNGFTLVELIIVILILGVLSATALPRFIDQRDHAIIAKHRAVVNAFKSGLTFAHQAWILDGAKPQRVTLQVFEDAETITFEATGWPYSVNGHLDQNNHLCGRLFNALIRGDVTASSNVAHAPTYKASRGSGGGCTYRFEEDHRLSFAFSAIDGQVVIDDVLE